MKTLPLLMIFVFLSGCSSLTTVDDCKRLCFQNSIDTVDTKFEGISFATLNSQAVVLIPVSYTHLTLPTKA